MAADTAVVPALRADSPDGSAADNIFRQFCRYLAVAYMLSAVGLSGAIAMSTDVVPVWWTAASVLSIYGSAAVMFATSFQRPDIERIRWAATVLVIGYGLTIATWPLVWNGDQLDAGHGMWFTQFNGFVAATAALIWRMRWSLPYLAYVVISVQFVNEAVRTPAYDSSVMTEIAWSFCLSAMPYAVVVAAMRSGRILDATRKRSVRAAAEAAASVARAGERSRFDALTHDGVMSTLLAAARLPMSEALVRQAVETVDKLDVLASGANVATEFGIETALAEFRGATGEIDDAVRVHASIAPDMSDQRYPGDVVRTMSAAAAEALRNSVRHAGPDARRTVDVAADNDVLQVSVSDDGVGFNPKSVPGNRLGLAVSIRGRMEQLPGGKAEITASPGAGTTVSLSWKRP